MKKIICIIIATIVTIFSNTASAGITGMMMSKAEVQKSIMEAIPIVAPAEIDNCYAAMKNDGFYRIYSSKVRIVCTKNELTRVWVE